MGYALESIQFPEVVDVIVKPFVDRQCTDGIDEGRVRSHPVEREVRYDRIEEALARAESQSYAKERRAIKGHGKEVAIAHRIERFELGHVQTDTDVSVRRDVAQVQRKRGRSPGVGPQIIAAQESAVTEIITVTANVRIRAHYPGTLIKGHRSP